MFTRVEVFVCIASGIINRDGLMGGRERERESRVVLPVTEGGRYYHG